MSKVIPYNELASYLGDHWLTGHEMKRFEPHQAR